VFLTAVVADRRRIFTHADARRLLREAVQGTGAQRPWTTEAMVLLPDHLHMLWRLPEGHLDYSARVGVLKK